MQHSLCHDFDRVTVARPEIVRADQGLASRELNPAVSLLYRSLLLQGAIRARRSKRIPWPISSRLLFADITVRRTALYPILARCVIARDASFGLDLAARITTESKWLIRKGNDSVSVRRTVGVRSSMRLARAAPCTARSSRCSCSPGS